MQHFHTVRYIHKLGWLVVDSRHRIPQGTNDHKGSGALINQMKKLPFGAIRRRTAGQRQIAA